jgi:signal peptidase I
VPKTLERLFPNLSHSQRVAIDWVLTIVGAVLIVFAVKAWIVNPYRIPSSSMEPTLHCARPQPGCEAGRSDRVLANRFIYRFRDPHRGDVVVFNSPPLAKSECPPGGVFVKRIIGLPGDRWAERDGTVIIDRKPLREPYVRPERRDHETHTMSSIPPHTLKRIPKDEYLMMGDNRSGSCDSRKWGLVPRRNLIGPVFMTYWPPGRISFR